MSERVDKSTCKYRSMNRMKGFTLTSAVYLFIYLFLRFFFLRFTSFDPAEIFDA